MERDVEIGGAARRFLPRWLRRTPAAMPRPEGVVVAVASGKGGTGKSFLTTNLAVALHERGRRVVIVDCDFGLANAHLLLGVNPRQTLQHLLAGAATAAQVLTPTPHGPMLVAGASGVASLAELEPRHLQMLARALQSLALTHDVVLLDCAAGLSPQAMITVLAAQHVVLVTNPEIAALTDAYAVVKCLARQPDRPDVHLAVNRVAATGVGQATFERLADVSRRFAGCTLHYLGEVPEDPAVGHRRLGQPPLLLGQPQCSTARAIRSMADRVESMLAEGPLARGVEARMLAQIRRW